MILRSIIIDDEPLARELLQDFADKVSFLEIVASFSNGVEALTYLQQHKIDLVFLDIQMPDITGLELLKTLSSRPRVIFTTAYAEYAVEGFNLDATDYLLKPFDFPRFLKAVNKVMELYLLENQPKTIAEDEKDDFLFIKDGRELVKVWFDEIDYIQGQKDYVLFKTTSRKLLSLMNMKDLERDLPQDKFLRIHQSYIINTSRIQSLSRDQVTVADETLNVSQSYKQAFRVFLDRYRH
ncbi:MAG: response regulator transcription factor [Roseivirga sp.]|nr:response regulator transcription factor [Roseivirga sp.]